MEKQGSWPPPYQCRVSARAKRPALRICPRIGLEVVLPKPRSQRFIEKFINENRSWIEKHQTTLAKAQEPLLQPKVIDFPALGQQWLISWIEKETPWSCRSQLQTGIIKLFGCSKHSGWHKALQRWLTRYAKPVLQERLDTLSDRCDLPYNRLQVKRMRTQWGSCSSEKNIALNSGLLFVKADTLDYVLIHELCHTMEMNHSKKFYRLVEKHQPHYQSSIKDLKEFQMMLDPWWLAD